MDFTPYNQIGKALNWLAPQTCIQCEEPQAYKGSNRGNGRNNIGHPCCERCYTDLPFQRSNCARCGEPYAGVTDSCGRCLTQPPSFDANFCPFEYKGAIRELIIRFKYKETPELAAKLARLFAHEIAQHNLAIPELLLPVPMHISRLRQRGYNQSNLLAKQLGKILNIPVCNDALIKSKATEQQATQRFKQRKNNVLGSFSVKKQVSATSVAIVDDVVTTGSTAGEIAKILKKNGVDYIQVWGVAHTL